MKIKIKCYKLPFTEDFNENRNWSLVRFHILDVGGILVVGSSFNSNQALGANLQNFVVEHVVFLHF